MEFKTMHIIGLMSGTSLDGIDVVYVKFNKAAFHDFEILHTETVRYSKIWKDTLQKAIAFSDERLIDVDLAYGKLLGETITNFIEKYHIKNVDFISSHGHTVFHKPEEGITLQIGNGQVLATATKLKVVCDFRSQDVFLGGQGAPLVPIGDALLFSEYDSCLNLGGFANISFQENSKRIAFDVCPVNIVLNKYANSIGLEFDDKGEVASKGMINQDLLRLLNDLEFYKKSYPKSLGLEWVQDEIFPLIDSIESNVSSILRTFVEHVAVQITGCLVGKKEVLITGGGTYNDFLISRITSLSETKIIVPTDNIIDFKEALIFSLLGLLRVDNQINCLSSVTGAKTDHSSGHIFLP